MALSVIRGLILKEVDVGEADKILTLLVKGIGKLSISARGACRTKSQYAGGTSVFTYADFTVRTGVKHHFLTQVDIISSFYSLTKDLTALAYATYFIELVDKTTSEGVPSDKTLFLTVSILKRLSDFKLRAELASPIFALKLLQYNGFMPHTENCVHCGKPHSNLISAYGTVCYDCSKSEAKTVKVNEALIYTINYILLTEPPKLFDFKLSDEVLKQLQFATDIMLDAHFGFALKSKKFIDSLNIY